MAKKLGRKPQSLEPFTAEYLESLAQQLESAAITLRDAVRTMKAKNCQEIYIMYPSRVSTAEKMAQRIRDLVFKSDMALRSGTPLGKESVSSRSVRRTESIKMDIQEALEKNRRKKGSS